MRSLLIESQLILEALQDNSPSEFDLLWRVLQSSEIQGYISQAELDRLFVDLAQSQGIDVASSLTHHLSQVLTVFPTEKTPTVDVILSHETPPSLEPIGKLPVMTVSAYLERLTLDLVYRNQWVNSKNHQLLARWLRKYSDSSIDPFLTIPIAFTLLLHGLGVFDKVLGLLPTEEKEDETPSFLSPVRFIEAETKNLFANSHNSVSSLVERRSRLFESSIENLVAIADSSEDDRQTVRLEECQTGHPWADLLGTWSFELGGQKRYLSSTPHLAVQRERISQEGPQIAGNFRYQEIVSEQSLRQVQAFQSRSQGFGHPRIDPFLSTQRDFASQPQGAENEDRSESPPSPPSFQSMGESQPVKTADGNDYSVRINASQLSNADFRVDISVDASDEPAPSIELLTPPHERFNQNRNNIAGIIIDLVPLILDQITRESIVLSQTVDVQVKEPVLRAFAGDEIPGAEMDKSSVVFDYQTSNFDDQTLNTDGVFADVSFQIGDFSKRDAASDGNLSVDLIQIEVNLLNRDQVGGQSEFGFDIALGAAMPQASELEHSGLETCLDALIMLELNCSINDRLPGTDYIDHIGYAYRSDEGSVDPMGPLADFEAFSESEANLVPLISQV